MTQRSPYGDSSPGAGAVHHIKPRPHISPCQKLHQPGHCARQQDGARRLGAVGQGRHLPGAAACGSVRRGSQREDEVASVRLRTARGDEDVDAKRSRPSIGKPAMCHARKERAVMIGTDQRITSGPAARTAAFRGRIHGCTRTFREKPLHRGRRPYMAQSGGKPM